MKTSISTIIIFAIATTATAEPSFPLKAERILFLGDSITNAGHYIADIETQLRLQNRETPELINLGLPSETCTGLSEPEHPFPRPDVHERLERALDKVKPDVVVACYGMNDGIYYPFDRARFSKFKAGIIALTEKVHAANAKIVLLTPPPFDAAPLQAKGKLLPKGAAKYSWFAVYENYDQDVMRPYASWVLSQASRVDMVIDIYQPMTEFLARRRKTEPGFHFAADGVHMNAAGHEVLARAILKAWGVEQWVEAEAEYHQLVEAKTVILHDAWLSAVGHKRPGVKDGLPLAAAQERAEKIDEWLSKQSPTATKSP